MRATQSADEDPSPVPGRASYLRPASKPCSTANRLATARTNSSSPLPLRSPSLSGPIEHPGLPRDSNHQSRIAGNRAVSIILNCRGENNSTLQTRIRRDVCSTSCITDSERSSSANLTHAVSPFPPFSSLLIIVETTCLQVSSIRLDRTPRHPALLAGLKINLFVSIIQDSLTSIPSSFAAFRSRAGLRFSTATSFLGTCGQ